MPEFTEVIKKGEGTITLNVADPSTSGYAAGEGSIGKGTDDTLWIKRGSGNTDWDKIIKSSEGRDLPVRDLYNKANGIIWPLYRNPTLYGDDDSDGTDNLLDSDWWVYDVINKLQQVNDVDKIIVINPASGPGSSTSEDYEKFIKLLKAAGCWVIGYVALDYNNRAKADIQQDIDRWASLYPEIDGIFFDEVTNTNVADDIQFLKENSDYARNKNLFPIVTNQGTAIDIAYWDNDTTDIGIVFESNTTPTQSLIQGEFYFDRHRYAPREKKGVIKYGSSSLDPDEVDMLLKYTKWIYVTDDDGANPYDAIPTYLSDFLNLLAGDYTRTVTDNSAKLALTELKVGQKVVMSAEGDRVEEYLGGDPSTDASWVELRPGRIELTSDSTVKSLVSDGMYFDIKTAGRWRIGYDLMSDPTLSTGTYGPRIIFTGIPDLSSTRRVLAESGIHKQGYVIREISDKRNDFKDTLDATDAFFGSTNTFYRVMGFISLPFEDQGGFWSIRVGPKENGDMAGNDSLVYAGSFITLSRYDP